jgi:hypothetical protein
MEKHGIPARLRGRFSTNADCRICSKPVCEIKYRCRGRYRWKHSSLCLTHHVLERRKAKRLYMRRFRGRYIRGTPRATPVRESNWVKR